MIDEWCLTVFFCLCAHSNAQDWAIAKGYAVLVNNLLNIKDKQT
jgi:hypothetical protein